MSVIILLLLVIILVPFYKAIENSIGVLPAGILMGPLMWFGLNTILPYSQVLIDTYNNSPLFRHLLTGPGIIVFIVVSAIFGVIRKKMVNN